MIKNNTEVITFLSNKYGDFSAPFLLVASLEITDRIFRKFKAIKFIEEYS